MADTWEDHFQPGEALLWEGSPLPGVHGWTKLVGGSLFGLPFLAIGSGVGIAGFTMLVGGPSWNDTGLGLFLTAFSIPFVGLGLFLAFGQWIAAAQAHRRIRYALSTQCAYIAKAWWGKSMESYPILKSTPLGLEKGRSADTVWFHVRTEKDSDGDVATTRIGFDNIADGDSVYRLLRGIQMGTT